jgi:hypothetical protein
MNLALSVIILIKLSMKVNWSQALCIDYKISLDKNTQMSIRLKDIFILLR